MATLSARNAGSAGGNTENLYQLKWTHYQNYLSNGLHALLEDGDFLTDVTLASEGQFIQAHKMALALCSPFFKEFFKLNRVERANGQCLIVLSNIRFKELKSIVRFIYYGEVNVKESEVKGFLDAAQMLQIQGLESPSSSDDSKPEGEPMPSTSSVQTRPIPSQNHNQHVTSGGSSLSGPSNPKRARRHSQPSAAPVISTIPSIPISEQSSLNVEAPPPIALHVSNPSIGVPSVTDESHSSNYDPLSESQMSQGDEEGEQMISLDSVVKAERIQVSSWAQEQEDSTLDESNFDASGDTGAGSSNHGASFHEFDVSNLILNQTLNDSAPGPSSAIAQPRVRPQSQGSISRKPKTSSDSRRGRFRGPCYLCKLDAAKRTLSRTVCKECKKFVCFSCRSIPENCRARRGSIWAAHNAICINCSWQN